MKRTFYSVLFVCLLTICAQAQTDRSGARTAAPATEQVAPAEKVNPDGSVEGPIPASIATPEDHPRTPAAVDPKAPATTIEQKQPEKKAAAPKKESK